MPFLRLSLTFRRGSKISRGAGDVFWTYSEQKKDLKSFNNKKLSEIESYF